VHTSLCALAAVGYDRFFFLGRSRKKALERRLELTPEAVHAAVAKGAHHTDIPRRPIPDLGWSLWLWSGDPDGECYQVSFTCGAHNRFVSGNGVSMSLPPEGHFSLGASKERALAAYTALVDIWKPDQAVLCEGSIAWDDEKRIVPEQPPIAILRRAEAPR
jgi:hypothetical protein